MNAQEANNLTKQAQVINRTSVNNAIERAAKSGDGSVRYDLKGGEAKFADVLIIALRSDGFNVERIRGSDQRDNDSWDYLIINWA